MRAMRIFKNSNGVLSFFARVTTMTKPLMRKSISMPEKKRVPTSSITTPGIMERAWTKTTAMQANPRRYCMGRINVDSEPGGRGPAVRAGLPADAASDRGCLVSRIRFKLDLQRHGQRAEIKRRLPEIVRNFVL